MTPRVAQRRPPVRFPPSRRGAADDDGVRLGKTGKSGLRLGGMKTCVRGFKAASSVTRVIVSAAVAGSALARLTVSLVVHASIHCVLSLTLWMSLRPFPPFVSSTGTTPVLSFATAKTLQSSSLSILLANLLLNLTAYSLLIPLYRHSVRIVFNRTLPSTAVSSLPSFRTHLTLLKPFQILSRCFTYHFRVLPDILVLGEVRCGTTTFCQHLSTLSGCHTPFCLWAHPELDHKETFYFVGHYLGYVAPSLYRMCFPLRLTRWFRTRVLKKEFFTFDGCAQYLMHSSVPYLIAKAYRDAGEEMPVLVSCVRDPVEQAISWWNYENNAMAWGESMGLDGWNTQLRSDSYPPQTISEAVEFTSSTFVDVAYRNSEKLFQHCCHGVHEKYGGGERVRYKLPPWAMTWPAGQLGCIGRNGRYALNIDRYERVFWDTFHSRETNNNSASHVTDCAINTVLAESSGDDCRNKKRKLYPPTSAFNHMNVIPLEQISRDASKLKEALCLIMEQVSERRNRMENSSHQRRALLSQWSYERAIDKLCEDEVRARVRRNSSSSALADKEPTADERKLLANVFSDDTKLFEDLCNMEMGWQ